MSTKVYSLFLLLCSSLLPVRLVAAEAQVQIDITEIGGRKAQARETEVQAQEDVYGTLGLPRGEHASIGVQVAWRRAGEKGWWIDPQEPAFHRSAQRLPWRVSGVAFGLPDDCGADFEVVAAAVARKRPLPPGLIDYATLVQTAAAVSDPVSLRRAPCPSPGAQVRISYLDGRPVHPGAIYEVRLAESLQGEVTKPAGKVVRLVVQPINSNSRWVMDSDPQVSGGRWSSQAQFGREGLDEWIDFAVYAVVTDPALPRGRAIPPGEWHILFEKLVAAISPQIHVRRVELPVAQGAGRSEDGVLLKIHAIEDTVVDDRGTWPVERKSGIVGAIIGRPLSRNEEVWLLITPRRSDQGWQVLGKASLQGLRFWQMPPQILGEPGEHYDVIAVLSRQPVFDLSHDEIEDNMPMSRRVHVVIKDLPPFEVRFDAVDEQPVGGQRELQVPPLSSLEGSVGGRSMTEEETVSIFKWTAGSQAGWRFVAEAGFVSETAWAVPPRPLGEPGETVILLAVISKGELRTLDDAALPGLLAFSSKLRVTLKH